MTRWNAFAFAAAIGAVTGLRSFLGPAAVSQAVSRRRLRLTGRAAEFLRSETTANVLTCLAAMELVADKLPFTPDRTLPASLVFRAASGGLCGAAVCSAMHRSAATGAMLGSAAAVGAAFAGREFRRFGEKQNVPDIPVALLEDAIALGSALAVVTAV